MAKIVGWIKKSKVELAVLAAIIFLGAFLRVYRIADYMTFLGDEGRDAIVVARFLKYFDVMLIGPGTSTGNMYLGPLYYYLMAPALLLAGFSPVGPAVQVAVLGVATVAFVWWLGRMWWGKVGGLIAAGLYAVSPTVIVYSRSSWNPNIMPIFSLLCIYSVWKVWKEGSYGWLVVLGIVYAFVLQSHYLGLLLLPTFVLFWILKFKDLKFTKKSDLEVKNYLKKSLYGFLIFAALMSPLVIFDARHGWRNFGAIKTFFVVRQETVSLRPWNAIPKIWPIWTQTTTSLLAANNSCIGTVVAVFLALFTLFSVLRWKKLVKETSPLVVLLVWLAFGLFGLGLYKGAVYDHYLGFMFPVPFLLLGAIGARLSGYKLRAVKAIVFFAVLILVSLNLVNTPIRRAPNMQLARSIEIAKFIKEKAGEERFNIATISERNNRDVYQYFLFLWGAKVVDTDPAAVKYTVTDQLFVVCEKPKEKCDPVHDPSAWITNFGWTKVVDQWEVWGTWIFKLGHAN